MPMPLCKLNKSSDGYRGEAVVRASVFDPEETRPEAEGKPQAGHTKDPPHQEVPRLVNENEQVYGNNRLEEMQQVGHPFPFSGAVFRSVGPRGCLVYNQGTVKMEDLLITPCLSDCLFRGAGSNLYAGAG